MWKTCSYVTQCQLINIPELCTQYTTNIPADLTHAVCTAWMFKVCPSQRKQLLHLFNGLFSRTTWVSRHQKGKPFCIVLEQEMMGWQWHQLDHMQIICTLLQTDHHSSTHHSFLIGQIPFLPPNQQCQSTEGTKETSGQSNLTTGRIAAAHGRFNGIEGTLVPPGKCDWTCTSSGPPESTIQTTNWSVQLFLYNSWQKVPIFTMGSSFPQNCPFPQGIWPPSNTWFPAPTWVLNQNGISIGSAVFAGLTSVADQPTDHATQPVTTDHIYVRSTCDAA